MTIRREVHEWLFLYDDNPDRFDVFVEGDTDVSAIELFFDHFDAASNVAVYSISHVNLPDNILEGRGFEVGEQGRVKYFSCELASRLQNPEACRVLCIVDLDWCSLLGPTHVNSKLAYTDFANLPSYCYSEETHRAIVSRAYRVTQLNVAEFHESITRVLVHLFALRAAVVVVASGMGLPRINRYMRVTGSGVSFDVVRFIRNAVQIRGDTSKKREIFRRYLEFLRAPCPDVRSRIRDHDWIDVLQWFLSRRAPTRYRSAAIQSALESHLNSRLNPLELLQYPLFKRLSARCLSE